MGYLEENNLTSILIEEDSSWLKGPGEIVARLWIVGLIPRRGSRWRCAAAVDSCLLRVMPRVMEVTQQMVKKFEKAEQLLGVSVPMGNGKKTNGDVGELAVGASVKSAGSSPQKTSPFRG